MVCRQCHSSGVKTTIAAESVCSKSCHNRRDAWLCCRNVGFCIFFFCRSFLTSKIIFHQQPVRRIMQFIGGVVCKRCHFSFCTSLHDGVFSCRNLSCRNENSGRLV